MEFSKRDIILGSWLTLKNHLWLWILIMLFIFCLNIIISTVQERLLDNITIFYSHKKLEYKMIIPEITNSKLKKNTFIKQFKNILMDKNLNNRQIREVNKVIKKIEMTSPPFEIAAEGIKKLL